LKKAANSLTFVLKTNRWTLEFLVKHITLYV